MVSIVWGRMILNYHGQTQSKNLGAKDTFQELQTLTIPMNGTLRQSQSANVDFGKNDSAVAPPWDSKVSPRTFLIWLHNILKMVPTASAQLAWLKQKRSLLLSAVQIKVHILKVDLFVFATRLVRNSFKPVECLVRYFQPTLTIPTPRNFVRSFGVDLAKVIPREATSETLAQLITMTLLAKQVSWTLRLCTTLLIVLIS
mmetsp:Transcript_15779/g.23524  ORF Transcript_15779/g.23524 Transcript_15779/m.23524 type:complete len:200 (-) Transcript_15779:403-1002(-)